MAELSVVTGNHSGGPTCESYHAIDVRAYARKGLLTPGTSGWTRWYCRPDREVRDPECRKALQSLGRSEEFTPSSSFRNQLFVFRMSG